VRKNFAGLNGCFILAVVDLSLFARCHFRKGGDAQVTFNRSGIAFGRFSNGSLHSSSPRRWLGIFLVCIAGLASGSSSAHTPSETYLTIFVSPTNVTGQWDIALRDLQQGMGLDTNAAKAVAAAELEQRQEAYVLDAIAGLEVKVNEARLVFRATDYFPVTLNNGDYLRVQFAAALTETWPARVSVNARMLFQIDTNMHGFLRLEHGGRTEAVAFNSDNREYTFSLTEPSGRWQQFFTFVHEGVWHIWIGVDHILFLLALLLPSVLRRRDEQWTGVVAFRPAFLNVLKIVTAFTVAHSITLSLAALGVVTLPSRLVESVIAASVALAALNNLYPWLRGHAWMVAFGFGLVHGFGFASVLGELGLKRGTLAMALIGFNVGVELGQLAIVAVFLPLAFALRETWFYQTVTFKFGSAVVVLVAAAWMAERALALKLLPF
jgi:hypothetical protein